MVYGELGRLSLGIHIKNDYCFLGRLTIEKESKIKLSKVIYNQLLYLFNDDQYQAKWLMTIMRMLN